MQFGTSERTKSRTYFPRVGSFTSCRNPTRLEISQRNRPSALSLAECLSHRMECTERSPNTKTPTAPSLRQLYSNSKLLMVSTLPGLGGRYQQHTKYGPRSECTKAQIRYATSDISTRVTRGAHSSNTKTKTRPPHWPSVSRLASTWSPSSSTFSMALPKNVSFEVTHYEQLIVRFPQQSCDFGCV